MTPILIDRRDLIKIVFTTVVVALFVFAVGFVSGNQQAASFYLTDSRHEPLFLPEKVASIDSDIEPQMPEIITAGEEIDVDHPLSNRQLATEIPASNKLTSNKTESKDSKADSEDGLSSFDSTPPDLNKKINTKLERKQTDTSQISVSVESEASISANETSSNVMSDEFDEDQLVTLSSFSSDELNKIKYSIQVGMYGQLANAENMMEMLQKKQLNAYVADYTNGKNKVRYNVRFGYFVNKTAALSALKKYKKQQQGDGYLVKFSVENITDIAGVKNIIQPPVIEESNKALLPELKPLDDVKEDYSLVDTVSETNILIEAPTEVLANTQIEALTH